MNCQTTAKLSVNQHEMTTVSDQHVGVRTSAATSESPTHHPDGLNLARINALIEQAYSGISAIPAPTTALADGSAAERKRLRMEQRAAEVEPPAEPDDLDPSVEAA